MVENEFNETKALQAFDGSIRTLKQHLELLDRALLYTNEYLNKSSQSNGGKISDLLKCDENTNLNIPCKKYDIKRVFATSRIKVNEQAITELYRIFSNYIKNIILELTNVNSNKLLEIAGENKDCQVTFNKILELKNYDKLIQHMIKEVYRKLENERSNLKLIDKIQKATKIDVDKNLKSQAMSYLQIRHLIVHNNSKADDQFMKQKEENTQIKISEKNNKIQINYGLSSAAIDAVQKFCHSIDKELIDKNMVLKRRIINK